MSRTFGIDLGTSCSAIGWIENGQPRLLFDSDKTLLPSAVTFLKDRNPLVGEPALRSLQAHPDRTIVSSKRLMGSDHDYGFDWKGQRVTPPLVASLILKTLADQVEQEIGIRPKNVVITTPAWFTQAQREDTKRAGEWAGLNVVRIINEPTAAALSHAHAQHQGRSRILVYDLGGGTFDVSIVERDGALVEVKASHGDSELGGDDVDALLRDRVLRKLDDHDPAFVDAIASSPGAMLRLKIALEEVKIALGHQNEAELSLPFLATVNGQPKHLDMTLKRHDLNVAAGFVLSRTVSPVEEVLADLNLTPDQIDEVLLVGGSTLLPQVWNLLHDQWGWEGSHAVDPRRAVALGAAIQAGIIDGIETQSVLLDVAPYSLSVGIADPRASTGKIHFLSKVMTPRNTPIPSKHAEIFYATPKQTQFQIPVFQGADPDPRKNVFLGNIRFDALKPIPEDREDRPIQVEFFHDLDGLVHITVTDLLTSEKKKVALPADGKEQAQQRRDWLEIMERNQVIFGEGQSSDIDEQDPEFLEAKPEDEAQRLFDKILEKDAEILEQCDKTWDTVFALAQKGRQALESAELERALELFEEILDLFFEYGCAFDERS